MSSELDMNGMVRLIFQKPQICGSRGTIPPVEIFGEMLATVLRHFDSASKILFIEGAYKLAFRKLEFERLGEHYRQQETTLRASIKNHSKLITLIARAIKTLEEAHSAAVLEDAQLLNNFEVTEATRMLISAKNDLVWVKQHMLPAMIYPKLRRGNEKPSKFKIPEHAQPAIPGFSLVKLDLWLIAELDRLFDRCRSKNGPMVNKDKIIQAVFQSAFPNNSRQIEQIKTARLRARRERRGEELIAPK